ncbi:uncharacterized protein LOC115217927 [Argonauta hians]
MARILIVIRTEDFLVDSYLFHQGSKPTRFGTGQLNYNERTNYIYFGPTQTFPHSPSFLPESPLSRFAVKCVSNSSSDTLNSTYPLPLHNGDDQSSIYSCGDGVVDFVSKTTPVKEYIIMNPIRQTCLMLDSDFASILMDRIQFSPKFRKRFIKFVHSNFGFNHCPTNIKLDRLHTTVPYLIDIVLQYPKQQIDYSWYTKVQHLVQMKLIMDEAMALLSTLGGGYSALGEHYEKFSLEAFNIAVKQLQIAMKTADPLSVSRCYLYIALSLMQRGYLRYAQIIIRKQYLFAKSHLIKDGRLIAMCHGLWAKLSYLYRLRNLERKGILNTMDITTNNVTFSSPYSKTNQCGAIQLEVCNS